MEQMEFYQSDVDYIRERQAEDPSYARPKGKVQRIPEVKEKEVLLEVKQAE